MEKLSRANRVLDFKELDTEINNLGKNIFIIKGKDLSKFLNIESKNPLPTDGKVNRTKYKLNKKSLDLDFNSIDDIILPIEYEYGEYHKGKFIRTKAKKEKIINDLDENDSDEINQNEEEFENEIKNEIKEEKQKEEEQNEDEENEEEKNEEENKNNKIINNKEKFFGEEIIPPDDESIGEQPTIPIEVSDIDLEEEEFEEDDINNKKEPILISSESPIENNLQFTEHILNQVKSPIDMLTIGEKIYELINKKDNTNEIIDLYPLNTYKLENNIKVQLFKYIGMERQFNQFINSSKLTLEDYISSDQKEEVLTTMIIDNKDYKTNCSIWFGTNKAKLIRIPICSKPSKECQGMVIDSEEAGITSMDIFENFLIMGHMNGTIQIWEEQKVIEKIKDIKDIKSEILQVKFLKVNSKKKKYEFIFSDANGNVIYAKRAKIMYMSRNVSEQIYSSNEYPIYKICLYSEEKDLKIIKKKNIVLALASLKNVSLYKIRPKTENQCIAIIEIPYCNVGDFVFDCDFGYGFSPIPELNILNEKEKNNKISLIEKPLTEEKKEKLLLVVSYGIVIRLFEIELKVNYSVGINEIGYYITDSPVCKLGFISKSYLCIIDKNICLKIINTFCFENEVYKEVQSQTNNNILYYENIDLSSFDILKQNNIFFINIKDGQRCAANTNFLGSTLIFEQNIFIITKKKFLLYKLNRWDEIISYLYQNEDYKKMMWLSAFILGKNNNLFEIESKENIEKEYENCLQESLYIFLIKGTSEENNYKELRMLIEYCLRTGRFQDFYKAKKTLSERQTVNYLYEYLTEYVFNGNFYKFEFDINFLKDYINYYLSKGEKILLSKILIKISVNNLNHPEIIKILEENEILNPFIYAKIKERDSNKDDYFKPIEYLFKLFEKKLKEEKNENKDNKNDKIKEEYFKLITEHDMKYYYDKTLSCNDYIGHKLFWYINKCLNNEEYPKGNQLPNEAFEETIKKILLFLTLKDVMEILLQFDSYCYFYLLTKIFTVQKLYRIMDSYKTQKKYPFEGLESFFKPYLGNISKEYLEEKYFFYEANFFIRDNINNYKNNYYIKYDFYQMTASICNSRINNKIFIDKTTLIDAIKFFINYEISLEDDKEDKYYDPLNSPKIPKKTDIFYKDFSENIENNILYILKYLQSYQDFFDSDVEDIIKLEGLKGHNKIRAYLSEYGRRFDELFNVKLEEYNEKNPVFNKQENLTNFFKWINDTLDLTKQIDLKNGNKKNYHEKFKEFLKTKFNDLCNFSPEYLYNLISLWYDKELKDICFSVGSDELKIVFLNKYLSFQNAQEIKDKNYDDYLMMKLELLIKNNRKEQIIKMVEKNKYLWDNKYLQYLIKNEVYDAAVFISQKRDNIENCIKLTLSQIDNIFISIKKSLLNYTEKVNPDVIFIKLEEIKKFLDLGLIACSSWTEANKNYTTQEIKNTWLKPLELFYGFRKELRKLNKKNKLKEKYQSNTFDSIFDKIEQNILENMEYILSKMNDYIPLSFIVDVLCDMFKKSKFKDYSKLFQRMFFSTRRTEAIFKSIFNLLFDSASKSHNNLLTESKKGLYCESSECNYCNKSISENYEIEKAIYFKCGHVYHAYCCAIERGKYACYICRMNDCEESMYSDMPNLIFRKKENVMKNEKIEENRIKIEKEKKEINKRKKLIGKLKKINKKKENKIENFISNIDNIKIKI